MEKIVFFNICALIIMAVIIFSMISRHITKDRTNRYFLIIVAESFITAIAGTCAIMLDNSGSGFTNLKHFFHGTYLVFHGMTGMFYCIYLVMLTDCWHIVMKRMSALLSIFVPASMVVLLSIVNLFTDAVFYINAEGVYTRGKLFFVLYLVGIYYLLMGVIHLVRYRKLFERRTLITLASIYPLIIAAMIIEFLYPQIVIELFAGSIGMLLASYNIQMTDELIDPETGLQNSNAFYNDVKLAYVNKKTMRVLVINITNFSRITDMLGYDSSRRLIKGVAQKLEEIDREFELKSHLYNLGNGQIRAVVDERYFKNSMSAANRINEFFKEPVRIEGLEVNMVTCICAIECPRDIADFDSLVLFANDIGSKQYNGEILIAKNIYLKERYLIIHNIDRIIENAIASNGFEVYYQPIYSIKDDCFNSAEALLRLKDDKFGFISPEIFIPAAEKSGAIHKIGAFVFREVCKFISSPEFVGLGVDYIEINLSVAQCMQDNLAEQLFDVMAEYGVPASRINLEITETIIAQSERKLLQNLRKLTKGGIRLSLDDFGSGYSNFERLSLLPLYIVKLDKSMVDLKANVRMSSILEGMVKMLKALNLKIVVEGVETKENLERFKRMGCEYIQGFYFSKPIPKDSYIEFIRKTITDKEERVNKIAE